MVSESSVPQVMAFAELAARIRSSGRSIIAVDGRSASGKSTFAARLAAALEAPVVHTDDVAWHHSFFDWWPLLIEHVLEPFRAGHTVDWTPDAWVAQGRSGSIRVPASSVLIVEGVSSTRRELMPWLGVPIWMEVDPQLAVARGLERDGPEHHDFFFEWQAAEDPFMEWDQPWTRAALIVDGAPTLMHDPDTQCVVLENRN